MSRIVLIFAAALLALLSSVPAATAGAHLSGSERRLIRELNDVRADHGLRALRASRPLSRAADSHSRDMLRSDFFDHPSSDGTPFDRRVRRYADAGAVGETLAALPQRRGGAATIVRTWLDSASHRAIVLSADFRRIGVARRWGHLGAADQAVVTADFAS